MGTKLFGYWRFFKIIRLYSSKLRLMTFYCRWIVYWYIFNGRPLRKTMQHKKGKRILSPWHTLLIYNSRKNYCPKIKLSKYGTSTIFVWRSALQVGAQKSILERYYNKLRRCINSGLLERLTGMTSFFINTLLSSMSIIFLTLIMYERCTFKNKSSGNFSSIFFKVECTV